VGSTSDELLEMVGEIPTLPNVAMQLAVMLDNPETEAGDVEKVIKQDPSLASRLLKLVNSAFYGLSNEVRSISRAVGILGFYAVKNIALSAFVFDFFGTSEEDFDLRAFWMHSIACGVSMTEAVKVSGQHKEIIKDAQVFGLLHDLGRIAAMHFMPTEFEEAVSIAREKAISLSEAESEVFDGINHQDVGKKLAEKWNFPPELAACMSYHHTPSLAPEEIRKIISALHVADLVAYALDLGSSGENRLQYFDEEACRLLSFDSEKIGLIMDGTLQNLKSCGPMVTMLDA